MNEVKLGFGGRIQNSKELKVQRGSRVGELKRQSVIELSLRKFFQSKCVVNHSALVQNQCLTYGKASERGTSRCSFATQRILSNSFQVQLSPHSYPLLFHFFKSSHQSCDQLASQVSFHRQFNAFHIIKKSTMTCSITIYLKIILEFNIFLHGNKVLITSTQKNHVSFHFAITISYI